MCDCFHLAFPNWHASQGTGAGRRLRGPETGEEDDSICDEPSHIDGERPRPQGSSPVEDYPEKYAGSDREGDVEHESPHKRGSGKKSKKAGIGSLFDKRSTPKMSKLKEVHSPESGVILNTAEDGCADGLVVGGGGKDGIFIKQVVPESPASKNLSLKEGDQILSATVYFDNVTYEDALQILEHAQAYKVKLCLKRQPELSESEPVIQPDVINEEEGSPVMRRQGKTKRQSNARISWPKFSSFGKGQKKHFTRSHSSSEADEQRKLELSPTTSDTESPIKTQEALKGKKKHKVKLSCLKKRGSVSTPPDQDQGVSDIHSPEHIASTLVDTTQVYKAEDLEAIETSDMKDQKSTGPETKQHKVELISLDSTLKTTDLTVALADQKLSPTKGSPDGTKSKKKERSELKVRIMGKDKSHKQEQQVKSSPKRLKTLGASMERTEPTENKLLTVTSDDSSTVPSANTGPSDMEISMPKVDISLDMSDLGLLKKSPKRGKEKKDTKTFQLPNVGFTDIATEDTIQKMDVNVKESIGVMDPYANLSKTQLPKREDIEIPGMEDASTKKTKFRGIKEPNPIYTGHVENMAIDVDSVREAVSKLPGFKLPKVDTSGMPIPEEITMIDANAHRITVKTPSGTPTKVLDAKTKQDTHFTSDIKVSSDILSCKSVKLPKIRHEDFTSLEAISETKVEKKEAKAKQSDSEIKIELNKMEYIVIPGKEGIQVQQSEKTMEMMGFQSTAEHDQAETLNLAVTSPGGTDKKSKKAKLTMPGFGIAKPDIRFPDIGIDLPKRNVSEQKEDYEKSNKINQDLNKSKTEIGLIQVPDIDKDIKMIGADMTIPTHSITADITTPCVDTDGPCIDVKRAKAEGGGKGHKFKMPNLGISMPKVKGPEIDLSLSKKDLEVTSPEAKAEIKLHEADAKASSVSISVPETTGLDVDAKLKKPKFSMPRFSFAKPSIKSPEADVNLPEADVSLPERKVEMKSPEMEIKLPETEVQVKNVEGSPAKFKMPTFKLPKFGASASNVTVEVPEVEKNIKIDEADVKFPTGEAEFSAASIDTEGPSIHVKTTDTDFEGKGSMFKMPSVAVSMPKVKGPAIDLTSSNKDVDVTLAEAKTELKHPELDVKEHLAKVDAKAPEIAVHVKDFEGSPSKFKMPTFKMPKFGVGHPNVTVDAPVMEKVIQIDGADLKIPEVETEVATSAPCIDTEYQYGDAKITGTEFEGKGGKFKMPSLGISMPKVKGPEIDFNLSKKDIDVNIPKADVSLPEGKVEVKEIKSPETELEIDGHGSKFKMPKFGISLPKVKGPEIDFSLSKKDITIPEATAEVNPPDVEVKGPSAKVEIEAPEIDVQVKNVEGSPSKFKMPTFKLPKFGANVTVEVPEVEKEINIEGTELNIPNVGAAVDITLPEIKAEAKLPDAEVKEPSASISTKEPAAEFDAKLKKPRFSLPKFSFSKQSIPVHEVDIKVPDADVTLPEAKAEVKPPDVDVNIVFLNPQVDVTIPEVRTEVSLPEVAMKEPSAGISIEDSTAAELDAKFKKPRFSLPKFSFSKQSVQAPEIDVNVPKVDILLPEGNVEIKEPGMEIKAPESELEIEGSKFKMPSFGISVPKIKGPEIDLSLQKKEVGVTLPEVKGDVKLPDIEAKEPSATTSWSMPRFSFSKPNIKGPEVDVNFEAPQIDVTIPEAKAEIDIPEVEVKETTAGISMEDSPVAELDAKFKKPRFSLPRFSFSKQSIQAPEVDADVPKVDINLPEGKVEMKAPDIEIKGPESELEIEGQGSKFKLPSLGISMPKVKGPEIDSSLQKKEVSATLPGIKAEVQIPDIEAKEPSATTALPDVPTSEDDGKGRKTSWSMPRFSFSKPNIKSPEVDVKFEAPQVDLTLPEAKMEVDIPEVEMKEPSAGISIEDSPVAELDAKFKKPRFSLPRFSFSKQSVQAPEVDVNPTEVDVSLPEGRVEVKEPGVGIKAPEAEIEIDGQGSKFKMPSLGISMPKVKGPDIDLSLSKKDMDVTLPEAKAEVKLSGVEVKGPTATVSVPDTSTLQVDAKLKKPSFALPRFSFSKQNVQTPDVDVNIPTVDVSLPEGRVEVDQPEVDIKVPVTDLEIDGQGSKLKMPKFGISLPKVKGPEIDFSLSKKDVDVSIPEAKTEVKPPNVEVKGPSAKVEVEAPEIDVQLKNVEGSPSKFKMPTFKLPKFGTTLPNVAVEVPEVEKEINIEGTQLNIPNVGAAVDVTLPDVKADIKLPDVEVKGPSASISIEELHGAELDAKLKKPRFSLPKFSFSKQTVPVPEVDVSVPGADVTLPEAKADVKLPDVDVKLEAPQVDVTLPEVRTEVSLPGVAIKEPSGGISIEDSPVAELDAKFKKPRFSLPRFSFSKQSVQAPEVDVNVPKVDIHLPEGEIEVMKTEMDIKAPEGELEMEGKGSKFKMPSLGISMPKVKGPEIDLSLQKKEVGVTLPEVKAEVKLTDIEAIDASASIPLPDAPTLEDDNKGRKTSWSIPRFSFSKPNIKGPDVDVNLEAPQIDVTIPEAKAEVHIPEVEVKEPSAGISIEDSPVAEFDAKFKKPMFSLPRFSFSKQNVQAPEIDVNLPDVSLPEGKVEMKEPEMEIKAPETEVEVDGKGSTFKMTKFGISLPKLKAPEIDLGSSKVEVDVTLPEAKSDVIVPNVETKDLKVEVKTPEIEVQAKQTAGSPSKFKMPTFKLPRFGAAIPDITAEVPEVEKEINIDGAEVKSHAVDIKLPETKVSEVEIKTSAVDISVPKATVVELDAKMKKPTFSLPRFSFSKSSIPSPEVDVNPLEHDISLPEGEVVVKQPEMEIEPPETNVQVKNDSPSKFKMPTMHLPKFGVTSSNVTDGAEFNVPQQGGKVDVALPEIKADVSLPEAEMKAPSAAISEPEAPVVEIDAKMKKPRFSLPRFSFSKSSIQPPEDDVISPERNISIPEGEVVVKQPEMEIKSPEIDVQMKNVVGSPSKFKMPTLHMPKFGVASSNVTVEVPEDINIDGATVAVTLPVAKAEVSLPEVHMKEPSVAISLPDAPVIDVDGKLKKPRFSLPRMSFSKQIISKESEVDVKLPKVDVSLPEGKVQVKESELKIKTPETEIEQKNVEGSPSRFKMPTLKLSTFGLKGTPEGDSNVEAEDGHLEVEVEPQGPGKSPKLTLTSFGEILKSIDVEFDVPTKEQVDEKCIPSKEERSDPSTAETQPLQKRGETPEIKGKTKFKFPKLTFSQSPEEHGTTEDKKQSETKEKESNIEQEPGKSPVKGGWLRFLSSPSETEKKIAELEREQSPTGDTGDEDMSTTYSIQSSDAFADISSTVMSEQIGLSLSSPTKVTVKISDPNAMLGLGEMLSNIITSTTTELASVEPNLPEKVTILSSEASSSSLDTLKLESGKIHVVTSNIQATPEAQRTMPLTHFHAQSAGGMSFQQETKEMSGKTTVVERHVMRQSSSESRETVVVTKQVTSVFGVDSSGPISGQTASSIPRLRLRDTVHAEKMKFFDGSKK